MKTACCLQQRKLEEDTGRIRCTGKIRFGVSNSLNQTKLDLIVTACAMTRSAILQSSSNSNEVIDSPRVAKFYYFLDNLKFNI
ncbi:hypothetical protein CY34DRAFT_361123 [Suillus luteus UH-Slu-Lm8-n1]|uniref:Uncharacterized protein n=1 Tax=Suillus luteus UH-Slu-Lm8-n1 TaxID=930992 RepID=A0A0C9ZN73_9AGAM|nr:hypothetical protein CY34DRAFT_361123 [Suillus luteus UH-Slu-Lm8-n1]